jgi:CDP-2,3-bis-(O-geranylgeranyl)-sn-glycerol synthase
MRLSLIMELLLLLLVANGSPVVVGILLRNHLAWPLDGARRFIDGRRLFGPSKTVRGILAAVAATALVAPACGLDRVNGAWFGLLAMAGDLCSSFVKRRLGYAPGRSRPLLDQLPETFLPLWLLQPATGASYSEMAIAMAAFLVLDLLLSHLYRWIRRTAGDAG